MFRISSSLRSIPFSINEVSGRDDDFEERLQREVVEERRQREVFDERLWHEFCHSLVVEMSFDDSLVQGNTI